METWVEALGLAWPGDLAVVERIAAGLLLLVNVGCLGWLRWLGAVERVAEPEDTEYDEAA
jgi:hypothetical protein